jgi:hypothetical protein
MVPHTVQKRAPAASGAPHPEQARPWLVADGTDAGCGAGAGGAGCAADTGVAAPGCAGWATAGAVAPGVAIFGISVPQRGQTVQRGSSRMVLQVAQRAGANGSAVRQNGQTATSRMMNWPHLGHGTL